VTRDEIAQAVEERTPLVYNAARFYFPPQPVIVVGTGFSGETLHATGLDGHAWVGISFSRLRPATPEELILNGIEL